MTLRISVITPSYNQAQFLPANLRSVKAQSHTSVEHVVVDPGSTDGSREIAEAASGLVLIAEPDRGQSDGICKGFGRSSGDVLTWLNSDDFYPDPGVLEYVAQQFEENPDVDVIFGDVDFVDEVGKFLRRGFVNPDADDLLKSFEYQVGVVQPGVFMRRRVFDAVGGPSQSFEYCMDYEYWVRIRSAGFKWKRTPRKLAHHRWWGGMKTSRGRGDSLIEHFNVCQRYFGYIHWKWLDRYAEYLTTSFDGVVNHAKTVDHAVKAEAAKNVILRFVTQEMLRKLEGSEEAEQIETRRYIEDTFDGAPARWFRPAEELQIAQETPDDVDVRAKVAWHVFDARDAEGKAWKAYHVPNNFSRYFERGWYQENVAGAGSRLAKFPRKSDICVIVGNGPSLNKTNLDLLKNVDVIVSNFAVSSARVLKLASIVTVVNDLVAEQGSVEFNRLELTKVFPFWLSNHLNPTPETVFVPATVAPHFNTSPEGTFSWRSTVSFFNLQLAYTMGFRKVILVGFDHSYVQPDGMREGDSINQVEDDENHFDPGYFKGKTWQAADTGKMEEMYRLARIAYEADGREVINATVGGKLEVFTRVPLAAALSGLDLNVAIPFTGTLFLNKATRLDHLKVSLPTDPSAYFAAPFDVLVAAGDIIEADIAFQTAEGARLSVMICRHGTGVFERTATEIVGTGENQSLSVRHTFRADHPGIRVQFSAPAGNADVQLLKLTVKRLAK